MLDNLSTYNYFKYSGEVTFTIKNSAGSYSFSKHNNGTSYLFNTIIRALAGVDIGDSIPSYINILCDNEDKGTQNLLKKYIPISGKVYDDSSASLRFRAIILPSDSLQYNVTANSNIRIGLYTLPVMNSKNKKEPRLLAYIQNDDLIDVYEALQEGSEIIIDWKMTFSNK